MLVILPGNVLAPEGNTAGWMGEAEFQIQFSTLTSNAEIVILEGPKNGMNVPVFKPSVEFKKRSTWGSQPSYPIQYYRSTQAE